VNILALETTESIGAVAAFRDDKLLFQLSLNSQQRSAQALTPGVRAVLEQVGWRPTDVELVAVAAGPGSFTGLRVGVVTAKVFAYGVGARLVGVDTLEAIAARAPEDVSTLAAAVDAQRGQVMAALFLRDADGWMRPTGPAELRDASPWLEALTPGTVLSGPALRKLHGRIPGHLSTLPQELWGPTAAAVGQLAVRDAGLGRLSDVWSLVPHYSRPSAAQEMWEAKKRR
jgi:tRNA threonylcarbamoyladenosine biosynthesis protein TsaB